MCQYTKHLSRPQGNDTEDWNQWTLMVQRKPRRAMAKIGHRNPETKVIIDKS